MLAWRMYASGLSVLGQGTVFRITPRAWEPLIVCEDPFRAAGIYRGAKVRDVGSKEGAIVGHVDHIVNCGEVSRPFPLEHFCGDVTGAGCPHRQERGVQRQLGHAVQPTKLWALRAKLQATPAALRCSVGRVGELVSEGTGWVCP